jgi:hypothetical protein
MPCELESLLILNRVILRTLSSRESLHRRRRVEPTFQNRDLTVLCVLNHRRFAVRRKGKKAIKNFAVGLLPTFFIFHSTIALSQSRVGVRSVDFRNFDYGSRPGADRIVLRNGRTVEQTFGQPYGKLTAVRYVDLDGDGGEEAVVVVTTNLFGSGGYERNYYVYAFRNGKLLKSLHEYREQGRRIRIKNRALIIVAPYWDNPVPHCCPRYIETKAYKWVAAGLVETKRWLKRNPKFVDFYAKRNQ